MTLYVVLTIALTLWGVGLWRQGFFGSGTLPIERRAYAVQVLIWLLSILIVAIPLEIYRDTTGEMVYVAAAVAILGLFFWLGRVASNRILNANGERE